MSRLTPSPTPSLPKAYITHANGITSKIPLPIRITHTRKRSNSESLASKTPLPTSCPSEDLLNTAIATLHYRPADPAFVQNLYRENAEQKERIKEQDSIVTYLNSQLDRSVDRIRDLEYAAKGREVADTATEKKLKQTVEKLEEAQREIARLRQVEKMRSKGEIYLLSLQTRNQTSGRTGKTVEEQEELGLKREAVEVRREVEEGKARVVEAEWRGEMLRECVEEGVRGGEDLLRGMSDVVRDTKKKTREMEEKMKRLEEVPLD